MPLKYAICLYCLLIIPLVVTAQETPWCEVEIEPTINRPVSTLVDIPDLIEGIVDMPANSYPFLAGHTTNIVFSADSSRAAIGFLNESTHAHELLVLDMVNRQLIYRIRVTQIQQLRNMYSRTNPPDSVWLRHVRWIANSYNLTFQTEDFIEARGEHLFRPDDLYILNENGQLLVSLPPGEGGEAIFSPDGQYVVVSTQERIQLLRTDGTEQREILFPGLETGIEEFWNVLMEIRWEDSNSFLVFYAPRREYDNAGLIAGWREIFIRRIFVDGRESQVLPGFTERMVIEFDISPDLQHVTFVWAEEPEIGDYDIFATIAHTETSEIVYETEPDYGVSNFVNQWVTDTNGQHIMRFTDYRRKYHFIAPCNP